MHFRRDRCCGRRGRHVDRGSRGSDGPALPRPNTQRRRCNQSHRGQADRNRAGPITAGRFDCAREVLVTFGLPYVSKRQTITRCQECFCAMDCGRHGGVSGPPRTPCDCQSATRTTTAATGNSMKARDPRSCLPACSRTLGQRIRRAIACSPGRSARGRHGRAAPPHATCSAQCRPARPPARPKLPRASSNRPIVPSRLPCRRH